MYVGVMTGWGADGVWDVCGLDEPEPKTCSAHSDCPSELPFCYEGFCDYCSECHFCHDGIDGTCGTCGKGFPTQEQGSCSDSGPKICFDASTANNGQYNTILSNHLGAQNQSPSLFKPIMMHMSVSSQAQNRFPKFTRSSLAAGAIIGA